MNTNDNERDDDNNDIPVEIVSHQEYNSLTTKSQAGVPLIVYPDYQRDSTELYVWPVPGQSDLETLLYLSVQRPVEDFDASGNNPDFPQEWYLALAYNVAFFAAPVYALSEQRYNRIAGMSTRLLDELLDWSTEDFSIFIQPDTRQ